MKHQSTHPITRQPQRRGSTLVIVISMLALLSLIGTVFYTFAMQERSAAEFFAGAEKRSAELPGDPFDHANEMIISGAVRDDQIFSILYSHTGRHSMARNMIGNDLSPHTGQGVRTSYDTGTGLPVRDEDGDGLQDAAVSIENDLINLVDSPSAYLDTLTEVDMQNARQYGGSAGVPVPDVDYTTPDINNAFLGWRGWAIRDNDPATPRFERVQVIIPSFMRPQLMKSSVTNDDTGLRNVPTDADWYDHASGAALGYQHRSFRPHPNHIGGYDSGGSPVFAYLEATRDAALLPAAGAFPFLPLEGPNSANFGHMGAWTGHAATDFELDSDNDGDGIKEGIWLNLAYPIEETSDGRFYTTLFSYTIYDLDGLLDLNAVGNLARLPRDEVIDNTFVVTNNGLTVPVADSNQGLGPNEINPLYALLPDTPDTDQRFIDWFFRNPTTNLEQANMEWIWLLTGRMDWDTLLSDWTNLQPGRWGDITALYNHKVGSASVDSLPRPGLAGDLTSGATPPPAFNDKDGFDDNADSFEGAGPATAGTVRGFVHPMDFAGTGTNRDATDFRLPAMLLDSLGGPAAWLGYGGYSAVRDAANTLNDSLYMAGQDGTHNTADDLSVSPFFHALFEDPLETVMDLELAVRPDDELLSVQDMMIAHLTDSDKTNAHGDVGERLRDLAPFTFAAGSDRADRFTTLSHSLRATPVRHQLGLNNAYDNGLVDDGPRYWEWSSVVDSAPAFPPQFATSVANSTDDPFRPQLRALLTTATGSPSQNAWQMPVSPNHVLDIRQRDLLPPTETVADYLTHIDTYGLEYRTLIEHWDDSSAATVTALPATQPVFSDPPVFANAADQEYWARLDRQRLARDIYVMLYTFGGAELETTAPPNTIKDYTQSNNSATPGAARPLYSEERLRQMAQFAVNLVDAMDTDNVVTRFEYDKNLADGWDLDDLPWTGTAVTDAAITDANVPTDVTDNGLYPDDAGNRGVVFGVEAQQLTISEVLAVRSEDFPSGVSDNQATDYDDTNGSATADSEDRYLLHIELQNVLPMSLNLSPAGVPAAPQDNPILPTNKAHDEAVWRLARYDRSTRVSISAATAAQTARPDRTLSIMSDGGTGDHTIAGGGRFSIGMAAMLDGAAYTSATTDPTGFGTADLWIDSGTPDGNFELIAPDVAAGTIISGATPTPNCDLDLMYNNPVNNTRWLTTDGDPDHTTATKNNAVTDRGYFLELLNDPTHDYNGNTDYGFMAGDDGFDLVLQRRLNPNLPLLPLSENPWVEVDRFNFEFYDLFDTGSGDPANLRLTDLLSFERTEPLDAITTDTTNKETTPIDQRYNSIGNINDRNITFLPAPATVNPFQLWQAHFDRNYASAGELLNLPIVGPKLLTRSVDRMRYAGFQQAHTSPSTPSGTPDPDLIAGAAGMFLQPDLPGAAVTDNNAWYRLFQFVEVPSRVNLAAQDAIDISRLPGKVNLNTARHRENWAGVLDEPLIADTLPLADAGVIGEQDGPYLTSTAVDGDHFVFGSPTVRDRWLEFINERDGYVDTVSGGSDVKMWLPGTPNSRPFRSMGYTAGHVTPGNDLALDETILRRAAFDRDADTVTNPFGESLALPAATRNQSNRHWLEAGDLAFHQAPESVSQTANMVHRHQFLSKVLNNTTTVSNCFIMYATAGYFEAVYDTSSGVFRIGGRMGLDIDDDGNENNDSGWEKRAVFIVDRTELFNALDTATGELDWERLIINRLDLASDTQ